MDIIQSMPGRYLILPCRLSYTPARESIQQIASSMCELRCRVGIISKVSIVLSWSGGEFYVDCRMAAA